MKRKKRRYFSVYPHLGFTLVELLVVIAIIAMLMSVMLPSLSRARAQGVRVHCLANQHQLMLAWSIYATDNDDWLCQPKTCTSVLREYTKVEDIVTECKSVEVRGVRRSYGISNTMGGEARDGVQPYGKYHHIARPGSSLVVTDIRANASTCFWPLLRTDNGSEADGEQEESDATDLWVWRPYSWPVSSSIQSLTARHNGGCNMSFADGNGQYKRWEDARTLGLINGGMSDSAAASIDNKDLDYMVRALARN